jgi:hypothetical protein
MNHKPVGHFADSFSRMTWQIMVLEWCKRTLSYLHFPIASQPALAASVIMMIDTKCKDTSLWKVTILLKGIVWDFGTEALYLLPQSRLTKLPLSPKPWTIPSKQSSKIGLMTLGRVSLPPSNMHTYPEYCWQIFCWWLSPYTLLSLLILLPFCNSPNGFYFLPNLANVSQSGRRQKERDGGMT